MPDDHDMLIRLDEKVDAAEKWIEKLQAESATKVNLDKVEKSLGGLKIALWSLGVSMAGLVVQFMLDTSGTGG